MTTNAATSAGSTNGVLGRAPRQVGQLWQVPVFLAGILALAIVATVSPLAQQPDVNPLQRDMDRLRQVLQKPGPLPANINSLADDVAGHASRQPERAGEAHYLFGRFYLRQAETGLQEKRGEKRGTAGLHLETAEIKGVPPADQARLTYLRGKLAFLDGATMQQAIDLLSKSLPDGADNPGEGYGFLVQAHLRKAVPDLDAALAANLNQMDYCGDDAAMLTQARMLRGELLLKKGMRAEAIKALDAIGPKAPPAIRFKARFIQAKAAMEAQLWERAIGWWNELLASPETVPGGKGRIFYNLGVCQANLERPKHAEKAVEAWRQAQLFGGEEGQAAALQLAGMYLQSGDHDLALKRLQEALDKVTSPADYRNTLVDAGKARDLLAEACRILQESDRFRDAAELYKKLAAPGVAEELIGKAFEVKGEKALNAAQLVQAKDEFQQAALAYEQAAESRTPVGGLDVMWRCIECYRRAEATEQAVRMLKKFVQLPASTDRKGQAWFTLAELQKPPEAIESYKQCVEFNNDAFTSRALLRLADMALAQKNWAEAEAVLLSIKTRVKGTLTDRASHEIALVKLAYLYFNQWKLDEAAIECREIIAQYPAHPNLFSVEELLGECHRNLAKKAGDAADKEILAKNKNYLEKVKAENLEEARSTFLQIANDLEAKASELQSHAKPLPAAENVLLRKSQFVVAECGIDLPRWFDDSCKRYTALWQRYRDDIDGLEACGKLYLCLLKAQKEKLLSLDDIREAAEHAVEYYCHLDDSEMTAFFPNDPRRKAEWQAWLKAVHEDFQRTSKRRGG